VALHNFSSEPAEVRLSVPGPRGATHLGDLFTGESLPLTAAGRAEVPLDGYGYRWLRVENGPDPHGY
ncbi:MAG TPA: trehalose synthase, partial [Cryobacterium sp.]|nr:trehalose synthase [Cryobacterium sp.]